jgi:hypothetical protein
MRYSFFYLILFFSMNCYATIYTQTDKAGNIIYSDTPLSNQAKIVDMPEATNTISAPPPKEVVKTEEIQETISPIIVAPSYTQFLISSPKDQETIQNQPTFIVSMQVEPSLKKGDKVQVIVDGKPWGKPAASNQLEVAEIERGSHQLSAVIMDENNQVLKQSNIITIFVHRNSIVTSPTRPKTQP